MCVWRAYEIFFRMYRTSSITRVYNVRDKIKQYMVLVFVIAYYHNVKIQFLVNFSLRNNFSSKVYTNLTFHNDLNENFIRS